MLVLYIAFYKENVSYKALLNLNGIWVNRTGDKHGERIWWNEAELNAESTDNWKLVQLISNLEDDRVDYPVIAIFRRKKAKELPKVVHPC